MIKKLFIAGLLLTHGVAALYAQDDKTQKRLENNSKEITEMIAKLDELYKINQSIAAKSINKTEYDSVLHILSNTQANATAQQPTKTVTSELNWLHDEAVMLEELVKNKKSGNTGNQSAETKILVKQIDTVKTAARAQKVMLDTITHQLAAIKKIVENVAVKDTAKTVNSNMTRIDEKGQSVNLEYGYYVVLESFRGKEGTPKVIKAWKKKGLDVIVVYNKERNWFFVYSEKYDNLDTALKAMEKTRANGLVKDAWVHNYHPVN